MGNHLSGIVPVQLHPTEYYLSDIAATECVTFDGNLGSTRFFKVARVKLHQVRPQASDIQSSISNQYSGLDAPSLGVAKVFVINDPTLPLKAHKEMIDWVKEILKDNPNALAFSKAVINEKTAVLIRQYIKYNLYDRISTRPFLTFFEKTWVAYQILKSAEWIHEKGICHGDIKLENILITSYLWVLLTDFATYKPVFLPEDNPADFSYFFDTSRRRTCNVAPERFTHESYSQGDLTPPEYVHSSVQDSITSIDNQPSMDLFSIGCVLAELFTEISSNGGLFDLSTLLSYRAGDRNIQSYNKIIDAIPDEQIRQTVLNLTGLDPKLRKSASHHLKALTPTLFPNYFSDLFILIKDIIKLHPDEKVSQIANKLQIIIPLIKKENPKGLLLLIVLVTSVIRSLKHLTAKTKALRLLRDILNCDVETLSPYILDRILPYLLIMLRDPISMVRVEAINSLAFCLSKVEKVPPSDNNVFPDYILPNLTQLAKDPSVHVRIALAEHLAEFADTASKFLTNSTRDVLHYNTELAVLHSGFQTMVANLLTDPSSAVKIWLLTNNISKLCKFFGHQKTNELILSHIFTFLNGTEVHELRSAFFDNVVPIAEYLGSPCLELLKPFLQQGLADTEETVIYRTLICLSRLTVAKLWQKPIVFEILSDAVSLLSHPNIWIRHSLVHFIHLLSLGMSSADIYCKVLPIIKPYLVREIYSLQNVDVILENLKNPIPRQVLNTIIQPSRFTNLKDTSFVSLMDCLKERKKMRNKARNGKQNITEYTCPLLKSLNNQGESKLTEDQEEQILNLSKILAKIHRDFRGRPETDPTANIITIRKPRKTYSANLYETDKSDFSSRRNYQTASGVNMNDEWQSMFGSHKDSTETSQEILDANSINEKSTDLDVIPVAQEAKENNLNGNSPQFTTCPPCVNDLHDLISHKKHYFIYNVAEMTNSTSEPRCDSKHGLASHMPRGILLGQFHEHTGSVNRMVLIEPSTVFVTCSSDYTLKVWDAAKVEDRNCMINKSKQSFRVSEDETHFKTVVYAPGTNNLLSFTKSNTLYVLQMDNSSSKMKLNRKIKMYCCNEPNTWLTDLCVVSPNVFAASNTASQIVGRDLRQPLNQAPAWKIDEPLVKGMITALEGNEHVLCVGTSRGTLTVYDLRFYLEASLMNFGKSKNGRRVMRLLFSRDILYSAIQGNNEVILWNCGTSEKIRSLWASDLPALTSDNKDLNARSVNGIITLDINGNECVVTGGTDFKIRFWDCQSLNNCALISDSGRSVPWPYSPSFRNAPSEYTVHYAVKIIEGSDVIQEHKAYRQPSTTSLETSFPHSSSSTSLNSGPNNSNGIIWEQQAVSSCHKSSITDLLWLKQMNALVSSSADGCVKVWR